MNTKEIAKLLGSKGGKKRAKLYSKEQLSEWGKKGGRPKATDNLSTGADKIAIDKPSGK